MDKASSRPRSFVPTIVGLAHLIALSVTVLVLVWVLHFREGIALRTHIKAKIFNVHPLLMVGFIVLSGEAILVQKTLPGTTRVQKGTHLVLHLSGLIIGAIGVYAVFKFHQELSIPHVYTLHSWLGLITIFLYCLQWLFSFLTFAYPQLKSSTRSAVVPWHVVGGMLLFLLAVSTAFVGIGEKFIYAKLLNCNVAKKRSLSTSLVYYSCFSVLLLPSKSWFLACTNLLHLPLLDRSELSSLPLSDFEFKKTIASIQQISCYYYITLRVALQFTEESGN